MRVSRAVHSQTAAQAKARTMNRLVELRAKGLASLAAAILSAAAATPVTASAQEDRQVLVSHDAVRALIGNTIVYSTPGQGSRQTGVFLLLDGTGWAAVRGDNQASGIQAIRWANYSDGTFCVTGTGNEPRLNDCGVLSIRGTRVTLAPASGPVWSGTVLEGDPWQLDPGSRSSQMLAGRDAIGALVGNTLVFIPYGGGREYRAQLFMADGTVRRAHNDRPDFDHWALQPDERWSIGGDGDRLCLNGGAWTEELCTTLSVAGDLVTLGHARVGPLHGMLLQGDARNLSHAAEARAAQLADALAGKSILLKAADRQAATDSIMFFRPDGSGLAKWRQGAPKPTKWLVQLDGRLCITEQRLEFRNDDCAALSIDGDAVTLASLGRPTISGTLLNGNALQK